MTIGSARVPTLADRVALRLPANRAGGASGAERLLQADEFASTLRRTQRARDPRRATMARLKYGAEDAPPAGLLPPPAPFFFNLPAHPPHLTLRLSTPQPLRFPPLQASRTGGSGHTRS